MARPAGPTNAKSAKLASFILMACCLAGGIQPTSATMGLSMCCASHRPGVARVERAKLKVASLFRSISEEIRLAFLPVGSLQSTGFSGASAKAG
jgi:hypothetical protein